jgi:hypothetical protein
MIVLKIIGVVILILYLVLTLIVYSSNLCDFYNSRITYIKNKTDEEKYEAAISRIAENIKIITDSYILDPRFGSMPVNTVFDTVKTTIMGCISKEDMVVLKKLSPNIDLIISTAILNILTSEYIYRYRKQNNEDIE